jgi:hypothetical protein
MFVKLRTTVLKLDAEHLKGYFKGQEWRSIRPPAPAVAHAACVHHCAAMPRLISLSRTCLRARALSLPKLQLLILTFRTPAMRLATLGWCIAPGETSAAYTSLLQWAIGMGAVGDPPQQWSLRDWLQSPDMVVISDWAKAIVSAVRQVLPHARHL